MSVRNFVGVAAVAGTLFGTVMFSFYALSLRLDLGSYGFRYFDALRFAAVLGVLSGVVFGVLMACFFHFYARQRDRWCGATDPCRSGEELIKQGGANRFSRPGGEGGYLRLTNERLLFEPFPPMSGFPVLQERRGLSLPLEDIVSVQPYTIFKFIPRGLEIASADRAERFRVEEHHAQWAKEIFEAKNVSA